jgi:hypothetical protein
MNKEQIEALKAQIEQLRGAIRKIGAVNSADEEYEAIGFALKMLGKTPTQCLAEIKAQAVEDFCSSFHGLALDQCPTTDDCSEDLVIGWKAGNIDCRMAGRKYANQLRQQAGVQE